MGQCGYVDSGEAQPGGGGQDRGRGVSAAMVDAGAPEAGHHSERGGSRFYGGGKAARDGVLDGIPETVYGADGVADEFGGGEIQSHALYRAGGGGAIAADRLRKRGEPVAGAGDHAGKRVFDPVGAGGEPLAVDPATSCGGLDSGHRRSGGGHTSSFGWSLV